MPILLIPRILTHKSFLYAGADPGEGPSGQMTLLLDEH